MEKHIMYDNCQGKKTTYMCHTQGPKNFLTEVKSSLHLLYAVENVAVLKWQGGAEMPHHP